MYEHETRHWWFAGTRRVVLDVLARHLPADDRPPRLVDVGCGTGGTTVRLARLGRAVGVDLAPAALTLARERGKAADPAPLWLRADAAGLPLATGWADAVTLLDLLEHTDDERPVLAEALRVLRPGGLLLVTVPALPALWSEHDEALHHRRRYRRSGLKNVLEDQGVEIQLLTHYNSLLLPAVAVARGLGRLRRAVRPRGGPPESDLALPPGPINRLLAGLLASERHLIRRTRLPLGVSLLAVGRRAATEVPWRG